MPARSSSARRAIWPFQVLLLAATTAPSFSAANDSSGWTSNSCPGRAARTASAWRILSLSDQACTLKPAGGSVSVRHTATASWCVAACQASRGGTRNTRLRCAPSRAAARSSACRQPRATRPRGMSTPMAAARPQASASSASPAAARVSVQRPSSSTTATQPPRQPSTPTARTGA